MITDMKFVQGVDPCPTVKWNEEVPEFETEAALEKLISYVSQQGVEVTFDSAEPFHFSHQSRSINLTFLGGLSYYIMLHEVGHMMNYYDNVLPSSNDPKDTNETPFFLHYPGYIAEDGDPVRGDFAARSGIARLHEEMDAWRKGIDVAALLSLHEEMDAWRKGIDVAALLSLPLSLWHYTEFSTYKLEGYVRALEKWL
jgi:hypothetical protein